MKKGFSIIEIVLATAILSLIIVGVTSAWLYGEEATVKSGDRGRAILIANEGIDIVRNIRDAAALGSTIDGVYGFGSIADGVYGLAQTATGWTLLPSVENIGVYTRSLAITSPSEYQKNITMTVSWPSLGGRAESVSFSSIFTNWRAGGNYIIGGGGGGGGESGGGAPTLSTNGDGSPVREDQYRLEVRPDSGTLRDFVYSIDGFSGTISIYSVRDDGAVDLAAGLVSEGDLINNIPTNIFVSRDYLYVTTSNLKESLLIFSLEDPVAPHRVGVYNASTITDASTALSVYVTNDGDHDDVAYIGYENRSALPDLIAVDVTSPEDPTTLNTLAVGKSVGDIFIDSNNVGHIAAVTSDGENNLYYESFDASSDSLLLLGSVEIPMSFNIDILDLLLHQVSISVSGSIAYVGGGKTTAAVDVNDPALPTLSSYVEDSLSYYFSLNLRSGYVFAVGDVQMSTFHPSSGLTIVASNFFLDPSGVAVAYSSNLDFVYTIELSEFHVYTVD